MGWRGGGVQNLRSSESQAVLRLELPGRRGDEVCDRFRHQTRGLRSSRRPGFDCEQVQKLAAIEERSCRCPYCKPRLRRTSFVANSFCNRMSGVEFKNKWAKFSGKETSAYQEHF